MSVHRVTDLGPNPIDDEIACACGRCFYCGHEVQGLAVFWRGASFYCETAEREIETPSLFDMLDAEEAA